jgi:SAM-dependent methyltransferase
MLNHLARFSSVAPLIDELGGGEVLDVGSGSEGVAGWISPAWTVTAVDRSFDDHGAMPGPRSAPVRQVTADARELPFADGSFDVVLALDVLEHIEPDDRRRTLDELVRTARRRVIVACPTGRAAFDADRRLAAGLRRRGMSLPDWLVEHERYGFLEAEDLRETLEGRGRVRLIDNENIRWHEWLVGIEFRRPGFHASRIASRILARSVTSRARASVLNRVAVRLIQGPDRPPRYRTIAVLDLDGDTNGSAP